MSMDFKEKDKSGCPYFSPGGVNGQAEKGSQALQEDSKAAGWEVGLGGQALLEEKQCREARQ